ncbi:hypothetical protein ACWEWI_21900 [Streptomyces sp. NPDC003753]|uniref:hypothetical protein n=1 Tax=unclassified Streptomyces TaxID=2593676 RepID=UPI00190480C5|nr:hypothetical protein [Streptomyces sp. Y2F8-2]GHK00684.1 hypothetical protein SY2F82_24810 [Streptomyces sp. Y2F8-2]
MNVSEREATVRRMLERTPPPVPPDLYGDVVRRGSRLLRRRTVALRVLWLALVAAALAFTVWASVARPWVEPPSTTTPPISDW